MAAKGLSEKRFEELDGLVKGYNRAGFAHLSSYEMSPEYLNSIAQLTKGHRKRAVDAFAKELAEKWRKKPVFVRPLLNRALKGQRVFLTVPQKYARLAEMIEMFEERFRREGERLVRTERRPGARRLYADLLLWAKHSPPGTRYQYIGSLEKRERLLGVVGWAARQQKKGKG